MKVYFAGFGPGDPELLTLKAYGLLKEADLIIYPGSLISEDALSEFEAEKVNSHGMKLEEIIDLIENAVKSGKKVVRLQSGDPSIYGAIAEQTRELEKRGIEYEIIPGVSSIFASAASLKAELTMPGVAEFVFVGRPKGRTLDEDYLDVVAPLPCTIVILLGVDKIRYVAEKVAEVRGKDEPAAVVYHASREDEKVITGTLADIADKVEAEGIKRTAVIIIGKALKKEGRRSVLYG
ncbi:cobalt-precorrin-4/precorrin-4 C(11)-methyltransferase [Archaeoglobus veneficus]|uniref:Precorrin-4 C(11)-methyltransferase n=1 Tax=Archaeoglobus veneficus (strain DSM 11195 / SNP6) TaxID=693661 RepID=F2KS02_ARCVS|nr:SAM-dependent methyltransferase [Archaeoglobus veneficus]AEA46843.1 Precorrin-4 C(11)-methyltransferase [Archaeoglobus veneficus SNP6]